MMKCLVVDRNCLRTSTQDADRLACFFKQRFETEAEARKHFANKRARSLAIKVYQCPHCKQFHGKSSETRVPESKRKN